jgi:hypothetical protein
MNGRFVMLSEGYFLRRSIGGSRWRVDQDLAQRVARLDGLEAGSVRQALQSRLLS